MILFIEYIDRLTLFYHNIVEDLFTAYYHIYTHIYIYIIYYERKSYSWFREHLYSLINCLPLLNYANNITNLFFSSSLVQILFSDRWRYIMKDRQTNQGRSVFLPLILYLCFFDSLHLSFNSVWFLDISVVMTLMNWLIQFSNVSTEKYIVRSSRKHVYNKIKTR